MEHALSRRNFLQHALAASIVGATVATEFTLTPNAPAAEATNQTTLNSVRAHAAKTAGAQAVRISASTPETNQPQDIRIPSTRRGFIRGVGATGIATGAHRALNVIEGDAGTNSVVQFLNGALVWLNS